MNSYRAKLSLLLFLQLFGCVVSPPSIQDCKDQWSCREYDEKLENYRSFEAQRLAGVYKEQPPDAPGIQRGEATNQCTGIIVGGAGSPLNLFLPMSCKRYSWQRIVVKVGCKADDKFDFLVPIKGKKVQWEYGRYKDEIFTDVEGNLVFNHLDADTFDFLKLHLKYGDYTGSPNKRFVWELPVTLCRGGS